jgi:hypothetical protein
VHGLKLRDHGDEDGVGEEAGSEFKNRVHGSEVPVEGHGDGDGDDDDDGEGSCDGVEMHGYSPIRLRMRMMAPTAQANQKASMAKGPGWDMVFPFSDHDDAERFAGLGVDHLDAPTGVGAGG